MGQSVSFKQKKPIDEQSSGSQQKGQYTACYNCTGHKTFFECGVPIYGCALCKKYGNSFGEMLQQYRYVSVKINGIKYTPPKYTCLECQDTKQYYYRFCDEDLYDLSWSDSGYHNWPKPQLACCQCCKEQHEKELVKIKEEYINLKKVRDYVKLKTIYFQNKSKDDFQYIVNKFKV